MTTATGPGTPAVAHGERIGLTHGAGGRAMRRLITETLARGFLAPVANGIGLAAMDDGAAIRLGDGWLVVATDAHVVQPIFFPGGDIGRLAIAGTVNDLAMMGATEPLGIACAVVVEDGFPRADLERIQQSMAEACRDAGATIVTGDTKVMGRGELDGIVITTTGVAMALRIVPDAGLRPGDRIVLTGSIGDHGIALMARRHGLERDGDVQSDVAPLNALIRRALFAGDLGITAMKDPTRGGLASALNEMAEKSQVGIVIREPDVPIRPAVRAAAEVLGLDPFQIANEGKAVIGVHWEAVDPVLAALRSHPLGQEATVVGECIPQHVGRVILDTGIGRRLLTEAEGLLLPRIC